MKAPSRITVMLIAAAVPLFVAASCGKRPEKDAPNAAASASSSASAASPATSAGIDQSEPDDAVRPVYPITNDPPSPLAKKLCEAIHEQPARRKAECCSSAGRGPLASVTLLVNECVRVLSFALREKSVSLDPADVDKCVEAGPKATEGCEWVTPFAPRPPPACDGVIKGLLQEGAHCRASLECVDGLRCLGSGPTAPGRCTKPLPRGGPCSHAVDTLASYTGQTTSDARHPECAGYCAQRWCADIVPVGGECSSTVQCGAGRHCIEKKCAEGPLPEAGAPCRSGLCAEGARCSAGKCVPLGVTGEACERDADCRSGCEKPPGSAKGKCGIKCWASLNALKK
jgi:hypothetical protein